MLLWLYVNIHKLPQPCERALFQNIWQVLCARCNTSHCDEARGDEQNKSCVVIRFGHYHRNNGASTATGNQPFCVTRLTTNQDYNMHNQQYHQLHLKFFYVSRPHAACGPPRRVHHRLSAFSQTKRTSLGQGHRCRERTACVVAGVVAPQPGSNRAAYCGLGVRLVCAARG